MKNFHSSLNWLLGSRIKILGLTALCFFPSTSQAYDNFSMSVTDTTWIVGTMFAALISFLIASERDFNTGKIVKVKVGKFLKSFIGFFLLVFFLGILFIFSS